LPRPIGVPFLSPGKFSPNSLTFWSFLLGTDVGPVKFPLEGAAGTLLTPREGFSIELFWLVRLWLAVVSVGLQDWFMVGTGEVQAFLDYAVFPKKSFSFLAIFWRISFQAALH
jgi:hypothetical protein